MSSKTRAQLVEKALEVLGVLAAGQTAQIEDTQRVDEIAPSLMETLRATEVFYLNDIENIDEAVFIPLATMLGWGCRSVFGVTGEDLVALKEQAESATTALRIIKRGRPTYATLKTEFM